MILEAAPSPQALVKQALEAAKQKSIRRDRVDWATLEPRIRREAEACRTLQDAHGVIRDLLEALRDEHSFLWTPGDNASLDEANHAGLRLHQLEPIIIDVFPDSPAERAGLGVGDRLQRVDGRKVTLENWGAQLRAVTRAGTLLNIVKPTLEEYTVRLEPGFKRPNPAPQAYRFGNYGVIDLPGTWGEGELAGGRNYAEVVRRLLYGLEADGVQGWIIDLRRNDGGNMWPMFAGLTPLLGVGDYGSFVDPVDGTNWIWHFDGHTLGSRQGDAFFEDYVLTVETYQPLKSQAAPAAVLTSAVTSSSGEIVLIGLLGRERLRSFGLPTGGLPTSNETVVLADGSWLMLTSHLCADRLGRVYESALEPGERVDILWEQFGTQNDPVLLAAQRWLDAAA